MKTRNTMRAASLLLVWLMSMAMLAACQPSTTNGTQPTTAQPTTTTATQPEDQGITFPLKERFKFSIMFKGSPDFDTIFPKMKYYQKLIEETNVEFEWILLGNEPLVTLNAMFAAGTEGDVIFGGVLNDSAMSEFAASGMLMPIEQYVSDPKLMPNFHERGLKNCPEAMGVMTAPDGHIYSMVRLNMADFVYLEPTMNVNKAWLGQLGMEIPKTIEQFEDMLRAFRDNDMNGNGNPNDEIPLLVVDGNIDTYSSIQALLGIWGIATKSSALDSYTTIKDGVVYLAPMTDAYKKAISTMSRWYKEGLIWSEAYTANAETFKAKKDNEIPLYGVAMYPWPSITLPYVDDLVVMPYPKAEGYETNVYFNPGRIGYKNAFSLTRSCKKPEIILHWLDNMYTRENSVAYQYHLPGQGYYDIDVNGNYVFHYDSLTAEQITKIGEEVGPTFGEAAGSYAYLYTPDDYEVGASYMNRMLRRLKDTYDNIYKDVVNKEVWPRPYFSAEDSARVNELRTDVFNIVSMYEAQWVTGQSDINADWEKYISELKAADVDELVKIYQRTYDFFLESMKKYQ